MTDESTGGKNAEVNVPTLNAIAQYIKDFSFENPNAPASLAPRSEAPNIGISVNVNARKLSETDYEIDLVLNGKSGEAPNIMFNFELVFSGIFRVQNVPDEAVQAVVMIECPRLLFPFARQIVADAVRNGGFPPLLIDPIDFAMLYRQRVAQVQAQGEAVGTA
jgi:preprotein translocase subunit SecB